jgi:hypothetical protein
MNDFLIDLSFSTLFTVLRSTIKNTHSKAELKRVFLKLFRAIQAAYADDGDFS